MEAIDVSPEMLTLVGSGDIGGHRWPTAPVAFELQFGNPVSFRFYGKPGRCSFASKSEQRIILLVARDACDRLLGQPFEMSEGEAFLLPPELRAIALAILDCDRPEAVALPYRLAKSIELICEILRAHSADQLVPACASGGLSQLDLHRIAAARQVIDEHWHEKLTLDEIARRCGLNRSKLSRGFRELYRCSVAEALAECRLAEARRQLIATDLPVSMIGYRSGYLNNASFSRAFGRRYGQSPTHFRACALVA